MPLSLLNNFRYERLKINGRRKAIVNIEEHHYLFGTTTVAKRMGEFHLRMNCFDFIYVYL